MCTHMYLTYGVHLTLFLCTCVHLRLYIRVVEADPGSGETNYSSSAVTDYLQLSTQVWDHMRFLLLVLACQLMSLHWSCLASHIVKSS